MFVSVGTYHFDSLLERMDSEEMMGVLKKHGYNRVVFQTGR